ncbi:hypothetical protein GLOIN_2v1687124 [Rhizophagus clarus]|uniref:Uncharacterized protein n=1 Tax=Rhizophagus clarus TaxID=94130 RepID=A0A8H3LVD4_9GLOM|nr:hypothetical protein GLOIN_2v1687124 [Rhizophagus clarus]
MEFVKREDESRRFRNIRYTICGLLTAAYISYLVYLIYDFDPFMNPNKVVNEIDKATRSELELQWNFIAGMSNYVALCYYRIRTPLPYNTKNRKLAAGSFIQESTTEQCSSTILSAIGSADGALVNPWGYAHKLLKEKTPSVFIVDVKDSEEAKSQIQ